jgi:hypothetical protein
MSLSGDVAVLQALTATAPRPADPKTAAGTARVTPAPRQASRWQRLCWRRAATRLVLAHLRAVATAPAGPDRDAMLRDWLLAAVNAQRTVEGREPLTDDACAWPLRGPCARPPLCGRRDERGPRHGGSRPVARQSASALEAAARRTGRGHLRECRLRFVRLVETT